MEDFIEHGRRLWPKRARAKRRSDPAGKTVLFLGAGASANEVVPIQRRLLPYVQQFASTNLTGDWTLVKEIFERLAAGVTAEDRQLEDCLTFLDKAEATQEVIGGTGRRDLYEPRRALLNCIAHTIDAAQRHKLPLMREEQADLQDPSPMTRLGDALVSQSLNVRERWVVVSTNWDTTLDFALRAKRRLPLADYCTYTTPWERYFTTRAADAGKPVRDVPSVWKRPLGLPTVKLLKLHGSTNWLWCPTCSRLFVSPVHNIGLRGTVPGGEKDRFYCPECKRISGTKDRAPLLREVLVTPTMIKRLDMVHLKMIWYNALVELAEADRVVFVGYTAPPADFELRYLIAKAFALRSKRPETFVVSRSVKGAKAMKANFESFVGAGVKPRGWGIAGVVERVESGAFYDKSP